MHESKFKMMSDLLKDKILEIDSVVKGVSAGDCVYITGATCFSPLIESMALDFLRNGTLPYFTFTSYYLEHSLISDESIELEIFEEIPVALEKFYKHSDAVILIEPQHDPFSVVTNEERHEVLESFKSKLLGAAGRHKVRTIDLGADALEKIGEKSEQAEEISHSILEQCAKNILNSLLIEKGEFLSLKGGLHGQSLLDELILEGYRRGAHSMAQSSTDSYKLGFLGDSKISCDTIGTPMRHEEAMMREVDARILVYDVEDPNYLKTISPEIDLKKRFSNLLGSRSGWLNEVRAKKYIYAAYPSKKMADAYEVSWEELKDLVFYGMYTMNGVQISTQAIAEALEGAVQIRVSDELGTDFSVNVEGRKIYVDDGVIHPPDTLYRNFPAGEVAFPVHEESCEGVIFCPVAEDWLTKDLIHDLKVPFKKGKVVIEEITAKREKEASMLVKSLEECMAKDKEMKYSPLRTLNAGELGIGTNNGIQKAIGYFTDEKMFGSVHLGIGLNDFFGGTSKSVLHMDLVTNNRVSVSVEFEDGSVKQMLRKGSYVFK